MGDGRCPAPSTISNFPDVQFAFSRSTIFVAGASTSTIFVADAATTAHLL